MASVKTLKLKDLLVNTENYRFEPLSGQREAIDQMIDNQGDSLLSLAADILENGLNPNDRIQVTPSHHEPSKYIVLEGNRRTVAMKSVSNPDVVSNKNLKKRFAKLDKKRLPQRIECVVYSDPSEADHWIGLKHGYGKSGITTDKWDPIQKHRFAEKVAGKTSISLQVIKSLKESDVLDESAKKKLDSIRTTNLDRLIGDKYVQSKLGIELNNGVIQSTIAEEEVIKGLATIATDIMRPGFKVSLIYNSDDRRDYIDQFSANDLPDLSAKAKRPWQLSSNSGKPSVTRVSARVQRPHRTRLIPRTCKLEIHAPRINDIYHELMAIDVKNKNAIAVLLRVFVELSVDKYIETHKLTNALSSAKSGKSLEYKVLAVANHLKQKKKADAAICDGICSAVKDKNDVFGIDTLNGYVHNHRFSPKSENLIITWNNIQQFIETLWDNVR